MHLGVAKARKFQKHKSAVKEPHTKKAYAPARPFQGCGGMYSMIT